MTKSLIVELHAPSSSNPRFLLVWLNRLLNPYRMSVASVSESTPHSGDSIEGDGYYWFKAERATGRSIAQRVNGKWFTVNELGPITLEELTHRGWHIDGKVY